MSAHSRLLVGCFLVEPSERELYRNAADADNGTPTVLLGSGLLVGDSFVAL